MPASNRSLTGRQRATSTAVLLALVGIAAGLIVRQVRYSSQVPVSEPFPQVADEVDQEGLAAFLGEGFSPMGPPERYGPETLSQKINGKAEFYLAAGFFELQTQRFVPAPAADTQRWAEASVYEMESHRAAFSVFSTQRRSGAAGVQLGDFAYKTDNGLFFVHGPYYAELISSAASSQMAEGMLAFGRNFISRTFPAPGTMQELTLFPAGGLVEDSVQLLIHNAFGFGPLDNVFTARYKAGGSQLTGFLSVRASAPEARELASAYFDSLLVLGARAEQVEKAPEGLKVANVFDSYELILVEGSYLVGVHAADDKAAALTLIGKLRAAVKDVPQ